MNRPIDHCYWVVPGQFLAGEYPRTLELASSRAKIQALLDAGITTFIDLTMPDELRSYAPQLAGQAEYLRFPIPDISVPDSPEFMRGVLDTIDRKLEQGGRPYLHCLGGIGRTGTVVGCWLARHHGGGSAGLARLGGLWRACPKSAHHDSPETAEQVEFVLAWNSGA